MSVLFRACGGALIAAICVFFLKSSKHGATSLIGISGLIMILIMAVGRMSEIFSPIKNMMDSTGMTSYGALMLKSLGVGIVVRTTSDICRDLGNESLAGGVELVGKIEILILCLPFITEMTEMIKELIL